MLPMFLLSLPAIVKKDIIKYDEHKCPRLPAVACETTVDVSYLLKSTNYIAPSQTKPIQRLLTQAKERKVESYNYIIHK